MPKLFFNGKSYLFTLKQIPIGLGVLRSIEELENEGMTGRITTRMVKSKMREKNLKLPSKMLWELMGLKFLKHTKKGYQNKAGIFVICHTWRLAKSSINSIIVYENAMKDYEKEMKPDDQLDKEL